VLPGITEALDRRWKQNILPAWEQRHGEIQESRQRFAELNAKHASGVELTLQEAYDRARLTEKIASDPDAAFAQLRALHERAPDDAIVALSLGARLLARNDDAGHALVERATQLDDDVTLEACEILRDHHWRNGRQEQAHAWHGRWLARTQLEQAAENERNQILINDKFQPHGLPAGLIEQLRSQLRSIEGLRNAYLVRKAVELLPSRACYVLGFSVTGLLQFHSEQRAAAVQQRIRTRCGLRGQHSSSTSKAATLRSSGGCGRCAARRLFELARRSTDPTTPQLFSARYARACAHSKRRCCQRRLMMGTAMLAAASIRISPCGLK
jgi:hypothetical protein